MFQTSFVMPHAYQFNCARFEEWQRDLLVHVTIEPIHRASGGGSGNASNAGHLVQERAILRSFEFCLNNIYAVRSAILGFKRSAHTTDYEFMSDVQQLIPSSIFSNGAAKFFFPLFPIDDERSLNWNQLGANFIQSFYGCPSNNRLRHSHEPGRKFRVILSVFISFLKVTNEVPRKTKKKCFLYCCSYRIHISPKKKRIDSILFLSECLFHF